MLADYDILMKRAFKKGTYIINCDYADAYINIGEFSHKLGYSQLTDKLIDHSAQTVPPVSLK